MRALLDTHCWLWLAGAPERFAREVLARLNDRDTALLFSAASAFEIAVKCAIGKLHLPAPPTSYVPEAMRRLGVQGLAVAPAHALRVAELPRHHRDPFDHLLIAQAQLETLTLVTADRALAPYEVDILWAS